MQVINTVSELRARIAMKRRAGQGIGFVPTMGNLHSGHIELVRAAREVAPGVVVSIFVNPMQFGPNEDFARYPRTLDADIEKVRGAGADLVFAPAVDEMYPYHWQQATRVEVPGISDILCGAFRPGHFVGVATVVAKLFNIVQPDFAFFGEKDFQQLRVIQRMVRELAMPVDVRGVPTVRDENGLALSSRNGYLTAQEREVAPWLYRTLDEVRKQILSGERDFHALELAAKTQLFEKGFKPQYLSIRRLLDLSEPTGTDSVDNLVVLVAAYLGKTRLIDNLRVSQ